MSRKEKAIVLLSGGLDSTVSLAETLTTYDVPLVLTFNYGQRAFGKEMRASRWIADHYHLRHEVIPLPWLSALLPKAMQPTRGSLEPVIPAGWSAEAQAEDAFFDAAPVWVPNRNGVFLNVAAAYAEAHGAEVIVFGANAEEGERFPDNTEAFRERITAAFQLSTLTQPRVVCPVGHLRKPDIVARGQELDAPLGLIWSCYLDQAEQCGQCPSCVRLKHALHMQPAQSAQQPVREKLSFMY